MDLNELVNEYQKGTEQAFDDIYKKTVYIVKAAVLIDITNKDIVKSLVNKIYDIFKKDKDLYNSDSFEKYIYDLARKETKDYLNENEIKEKNDSNIQYVIDNLNQDREIYLLKCFNLSFKQISLFLDMNIEDVKTKYKEAKNSLENRSFLFEYKIGSLFNKEYLDNKERRKSLSAKLTPLYVISAVVLIVISIFVLNTIDVARYNSTYIKNLALYDNTDYRELETISKKEYDKYYNFSIKYSMWDALKRGYPALAFEGVNPFQDRKDSEPYLYQKNEDLWFFADEEETISTSVFDGNYYYYADNGCLKIYNVSGSLIYSSSEFIVDKTKLLVNNDKIIIYSGGKSLIESLRILSFDGKTVSELYSINNTLMDIKMISNKLYFVYYAKKSDKSLDIPVYYDKVSECYVEYHINCVDLSSKEFDKKEICLISSAYADVKIDDTHILIANDTLPDIARLFLSNDYEIKTFISVFDLDLNPVGVFKMLGNNYNEHGLCVNDNNLWILKNDSSLVVFDLDKKELIKEYKDIIENKGLRLAKFINDKLYVVTYGYSIMKDLFTVQYSDFSEIIIQLDPLNPTKTINDASFHSMIKKFTQNGEEYLFCGDKIEGKYVYSILKNDKNRTPVGNQLELEKGNTENCIDRNYVGCGYKDGYFYVSALADFNKTIIYKIDVTKENPIEKKVEVDTLDLAKGFFVDGKFYIANDEKLVCIELD